jgi:sigma-B regulation protein RsbU (phosphoserine phosphatase)
VIGDVCGSGADAAAVTSIARHTVRAAARHGFDHLTVLDWLNEAVRLSDRDLFCTAAYATLEAVEGEWWIEVTAGGHPLPVVASGGTAELFGRHGRLLGSFEETLAHVARRRLDVGDVVVFYTDGITDLPPPHGRTEADVVADVARFAGLGSADAVADAIHRSVTDRLTAEERADDIALVALRVVGPPPTGA